MKSPLHPADVKMIGDDAKKAVTEYLAHDRSFFRVSAENAELREKLQKAKTALYMCQTGMGEEGDRSEHYKKVYHNDLRETLAERVKIARECLKEIEK